MPTLQAMGRGALVICLFWATRVGAEPPAPSTTRAWQLADILHIHALLEQCRPAKQATVEQQIAELRCVEETALELSRVNLALDSMEARLQREEFEATSAHNLVDTRHEDSVARWNIAAVLVGNSFAIVGSAMQFGSQQLGWAGDGVIIGGAVLATAFGVVALVKKDAGRLPLGVESNLLAPLFDRPSTPGSEYPDEIWRYLDTPLAGETGTIRQQLLQKWTREKRVSLDGSPSAQRRIDLLTRPLSSSSRVESSLLGDRADMLADVRARIGGMSVDLQALWREVHAEAESR